MAKPRIDIQITSDSSDARKDFDKTAGGFDKIRDNAGKAAGALAGIGLVALGADAVSAAADLERAGVTIDRVFGTASETVKAFAQDAAENVGVSTTEYEKLAGSLGVALKGMGLDVDTAAAKTNDLLTVAGDMALALGTDVPAATAALAAALRGEFDALGEFGVKVDDATVKAGLAAKGISGPDGMTQAAYDAAYQQELLNQVLAGASGVYGGYRAETDTTAEHQDTLTAKWEDAKAKLGEALLPMLETAAGKLTDLANWVDENSDAITAWLPWLALAAGAVWVLNFALAANPIVLVTIAVIGLTLAYIAFRNEINGAVTRALQWADDRLMELYHTLGDGEFWAGQFNELLHILGISADDFAGALDNLSGALSSLWDWFSRNWSFTLPSVPLPGQTGFSAAAPAGFAVSTAPAAFTAAGPELLGAGPRAFRVPAAGGTVINVSGALDPDAVARQIDALLRRRARRSGTVTFG